MPMHRFSAILLDLDGTLLETVHDLGDSLNRMLALEGRRVLSESEVRAMIGNGLAMLMERGFEATGGVPDAAEFQQLISRFQTDYAANAVVRTVPNPGALEFCRASVAAGVKLAVVTNKPQAPSEVILAATGFTPLMTAIVGGDRAAAKKPDAAPIRMALELLGIDAADAVMIGDSPADVGGARAAGIPVAAYRHGYTHVPVDDLGADLVFDHFDDLAVALATLA